MVIPICALLTFEAVTNLKTKIEKSHTWIWAAYGIAIISIGYITALFRKDSFDLEYPDRMFPYYFVATIVISCFVAFYSSQIPLAETS